MRARGEDLGGDGGEMGWICCGRRGRGGLACGLATTNPITEVTALLTHMKSRHLQEMSQETPIGRFRGRIAEWEIAWGEYA